MSPAETARRRARALEAFMSQQIIALHRSGTKARCRLRLMDGAAARAGSTPRAAPRPSTAA